MEGMPQAGYSPRSCSTQLLTSTRLSQISVGLFDKIRYNQETLYTSLQANQTLMTLPRPVPEGPGSGLGETIKFSPSWYLRSPPHMEKKILNFFTVSRLVLPERHLTVSSVVKSLGRAGQPSFLPHHYFLACWFSMGCIVGNIQILYTLIAFVIDFYGSVSS